MTLHLHRQIDKLKQHMLDVGALVERAVERSVLAVETSDAALAESVIADDTQIDLKEVEVEEECLSTLALHQPVANDLRFVVAVLKMNNDLERIGDLAVNIAEQAAGIAEGPEIEASQLHLAEMGQKARAMLKWSLDALVELDGDLAERVRRTDDEVDDIHRRVYNIAEQSIVEAPYQSGQWIRLLIVARQLERIADHSVNIAKDVLYLIKGEIVRHRRARAQMIQQT